MSNTTPAVALKGGVLTYGLLVTNNGPSDAQTFLWNISSPISITNTDNSVSAVFSKVRFLGVYAI